MEKINTGRLDANGSIIHTGDSLRDIHGNVVKVFPYRGRFRVALSEKDLHNGISCSLGIFILYIVEIV